MLEIPSHFKEITPAAVDRMVEALFAAKAEHERAIRLGERAAAALEAVRHYKAVDSRLCNRIMQQCPDVKANVRYDEIFSGPDYGKTFNDWKIWTPGVNGNRSTYACVHVRLLEGHSVADLIAALRECKETREYLARVDAQITGIEEMIDTEERLRGLVKEYVDTRNQLAEQLLGSSYVYFNDAVRDTLPALGGKRY